MERIALLLAILASPVFAAAGPKTEKAKIPAVRWDEQTPGCTFSRGDDGKFRYGIWSGDVGITLAVDSQELEKVHRRREPFFAVLLSLRNRGDQPLDLNTTHISLEFVKHFQVAQGSLDPDVFAQKVQADADTLNDQTAHEIARHPEKKEEKQAYMRAFLKDSAELQEFVGKNSLRSTRLGPGNSEATGWILFSTKSKWIGGWKKPEEFILRIPFAGKIFEFPFLLPPKPGEVLLRKRD